ncbi:MAG TPA: EamA family transporter [Blastocatellia bacterium]|nr:EamA family transporter [Blastocatellia bacterium]
MKTIKQPAGGSEPQSAAVFAAMFFAVFALASSSIFITKLAAVPALVIAFYRMAIATALLLPAALMLKRRELMAFTRRDGLLLLLGGACLALHFGAWFTSLKYIPIATSVVLVNSHPLFVVIASAIFLGERPKARSLVGTLLGLAGMLIISRDALVNAEQSESSQALAGDALAVMGALAVVGYFIVGRKARAHMSLLGYATPLYGVCSLFLLLMVLVTGSRLAPYGRGEWLYFVLLAVVPTILGHTVFNWALRHVRPSAISVAFLGEPVVAGLLAFAIFGQRPPLATYIGGALILAGIYLTTSSKPDS